MDLAHSVKVKAVMLIRGAIFLRWRMCGALFPPSLHVFFAPVVFWHCLYVYNQTNSKLEGKWKERLESWFNLRSVLERLYRSPKVSEDSTLKPGASRIPSKLYVVRALGHLYLYPQTPRIRHNAATVASVCNPWLESSLYSFTLY